VTRHHVGKPGQRSRNAVSGMSVFTERAEKKGRDASEKAKGGS